MSIDVGTAVGYLDLDTSKYTSKLKTAINDLKVFNSDTATTADKVNVLGQSMTTAGSTLTKGLTLPLAGVGAAVVKVTSDFESMISKVSAVSGATGSDLEKLEKKAIQMGGSTKYSATEAAEAFQYMAMAGWKTEEMLNGIEGVMNLAAADGLDLATTSDIVTDALTAFGLKAEDSAHFADVLATASSNANTNVQMMGYSFKYAAPLAGALGYSIEDTALAIGLMANAGIKSETAGTALRTMFSKMTGTIELTGSKLGEYVIQMEKADGSMVPFGDTMKSLREAFSQMTEAEKIANAESLVGREAMSGLLAIVNASEEDYQKLTAAIQDADGSAKDMADTMMDNLGGQLTLIKSSLETLAISFGKIMMPALKDFAKSIQRATEWLNSLSDEQKKIVVNISVFLAALGPVLLIGGKLIGMFSKVSAGIKAMSGWFVVGEAGVSMFGKAVAVATGPIGITIAAVAGLVACLVHLYKTNEDVRNALDEAWSGIKSAVSGAFNDVKESLGGLAESFSKLFELLKPLLMFLAGTAMTSITVAISAVVGVLNGLMNAVSPLIDALSSLVDFMTETFSGIWKLVTGDIEGAKESFSEAGQSFLDIFSNLWESLVQLVSGVWEGIKGTISTAWKAIGEEAQEKVVSTVNAVVTFFSELPRKIWEVLVNVVNSIKDWGTSLVDAVTTAVSRFVESAIEFFSELPYKVGVVIGKAFGYVVKFGQDLFKFATQDIPEFVNKVVKFFAELPDKINVWLKNVIAKIAQWASDMLNTVVTEVPKIIDGVAKFFSQLPGKVWGFCVETWNKFVEWGSNMINTAISVASDVFKAVIDGIKELPSRIMEIGKNIIQGLIDGITSGIDAVFGVIGDIGRGIIDGFESVMDINSPSRVFYALGAYIDEGLANGLYDNSGLPTREMDNICREILRSGNEISKGLIEIDETTGQLIYNNTYDALMDKIDLFYKERDTRLSLLNKGTDDTLVAIDRELAATEKAYSVKMKLLEQEYNAKMALIDSESSSEIAALNAELDAINKQEEARARQKEKEEYEEEYAKKKAAVEAAGDDYDAYTRAKESLDDLVARRQEQLRRQEVADQKDAIREQINEIRTKAQEDKDAIREVYEEKKWQLEQQKADEILYLQDMQVKLKEDYDARKELAEVQTRLKSAEEDKISQKEKDELVKREIELKASLAKNSTSLLDFGVKVKQYAEQYGRDFVNGFRSTEDELMSYLNRIIRKANEAKRAKEAASSSGGSSGGSGAEGLFGLTSMDDIMAEGLYSINSYSVTNSSLESLSTAGIEFVVDYDRLGRTIATNCKPSIEVKTEVTSPKPLSESKIREEQEAMLRDLAFEYDL